MDETPTPANPYPKSPVDPLDEQSFDHKKYATILTSFIVVAVLVGGIIYYVNSANSQDYKALNNPLVTPGVQGASTQSYGPDKPSVLPTKAPKPTPTKTPTTAPTSTPNPTSAPTATAAPTHAPDPTATPTPTDTPTPTPTDTPTATPTPTPTDTP